MIKFENKETLIKDGEQILGYSDLVKICSTMLPKDIREQGWNKTNIKESYRIEDAVKDVELGETCEIEDNDITLIKKYCVGFPWMNRHIDLADFDDYIENL